MKKTFKKTILDLDILDLEKLKKIELIEGISDLKIRQHEIIRTYISIIKKNVKEDIKKYLDSEGEK